MGVPWRSRLVLIELKRSRYGALSPRQRALHERLENAGFPVTVRERRRWGAMRTDPGRRAAQKPAEARRPLTSSPRAPNKPSCTTLATMRAAWLAARWKARQRDRTLYGNS